MVYDENELYIKTKTAFRNFKYNNLSNKNITIEKQNTEINQ